MSESTLEQTQRLLSRLIRAPEGIAAAIASGEAGRDGAELHAAIVSTPALDAAGRLEVYANAYFFRILGVLEEQFRILAKALGADEFNDLVTSYLAVFPPSRPSLRHAGERLAGFVAEHEAAASFRERHPYAADLARLEWALADAFDARDVAAATRDEFAAIAPEAWAELRLRLQPCVALLDVAWPVHDLRRVLDDAATDALPSLRPRTCTICVWRRDERVFTRALDALEASALRALARGRSFGDVIEATAARSNSEEAPRRAAAWLERWLRDELIEARA